MSPLFETFVAMARLSVRDPRHGARMVLSYQLAAGTSAVALTLIAVLSSLLSHLGFLAVPIAEDPLSAFLIASPIRSATLQWVILAGTVLLVYRVGRMMGGRGSLPGSLAVVAWVEFLMFVVQAALLVILILLPSVAALFNIGAVALFFWLLSGFVAELHGFKSRLVTFVGILVCGFVAAFVLVMAVALIFGPGALANV